MKQRWRSYTEAKALVHTLGFKNRHAWKAYCRSGQRPYDIPTHPENSYKGDWKGWGEFLGTGTIAPFQREFLSFEEARALVRSFGLQDTKAWNSACTTGVVPVTIPRSPQKTYHSEWQGWRDWLGSKTLLPRKREFLSFEEARTFAHSLGLHSSRQWRAYCLSGARPPNVPAQPHITYSGDWKDWGDFLGSGHLPLHRTYLPFEEARTFVHSLCLRTAKEWSAYCASGCKPANIPGKPGVVYGKSFVGIGDWLGTGRVANYHRVFLPFEEARAFARSLGLKTREEWNSFYETGRVPLSIPKSAEHVYHTEFRGWWDWLGVVHQWKKTALIALLEDLQPVLPLLSERELYSILQQGGALPALRIALGEPSTLTVLRRILTQEVQVLQKILASDKASIDVEESELNINEDVPEKLEVTQQERPNDVLDETSQQNITKDLESSLVSYHYRKEHLHLADHLARLPGHLGDEVAEYLITSRVSSLWEIYSQEGQQAIDHLLGDEEGGQFFSEIKHRFLAEVAEIERLDWTEGWAFTVNGRQAEPNVMQRRIAWLVREKRRVGNWSGVGSGKTISALLSSRISHTSLTLIITNYPTISGWVQSIRNVYPDSLVSTDPQALLASDSHQYRYLVLNYEKFQNAGRHQLVQQLLTLGIQLIVLDEIQLVKQREAKISQRSKAVQTLISKASQRDPHLCVLGMSATPIINSLLEGKRLLEMTIGKSFSELGTAPTIANALAMHRALMQYGFRFRPRYEQEMHVRYIPVKCNDLLPTLQQAQASILALEQSVLPAKLDAIEPYLRPGTLIYTHYIEGMLPLIQQHLAHLGFSTGLYTGSDKSGFQLFLDGQVDLLVGSSAVGTGLDGLQQRCDQIILLSLPWTSAAIEQIIGRARRQGSRFHQIEIVLPQVILEEEGETWSWDVQRWNMLQRKRTLSDCVLDGRIPEVIRLDEQTLLRQSSQALQQWIEHEREKQVPHRLLQNKRFSLDDAV